MAIKVGGTTVIDDSRALTNIASVDAATVTALSTAGVGGGGGSFDAVASGTLSDGTTVIVNSDGTVSAVAGVSSNIGSSTFITPGTSYNAAAVYDETANKLLVSYRDDSDSSIGKVVVGTVSGSSISFGSPVTMTGDALNDIQGAHDSSTGRSIFFWRRPGDATYKYSVYTVSGFTPSKLYDGSFTTVNTDWLVPVYDSTSNQVAVFYEYSNAGHVKLATLGASSTTFGSNAVFESTSYLGTVSADFDSNTGKCIVVYELSGTLWGKVGTVSGSSISFGSEAAIISANQASISFNPNTSSFICAVKSTETSPNKGKATQLLIAGTSITVGSFSTFLDGVPESMENGIGAVYSPISKKTFLAFRDTDVNELKFVLFSVDSSGSVTFDTPVSVDGNVYYNYISVYDPDSEKIILSSRDPNNNNRYNSRIITTPSTNVTSENFIGFSDGAYTNGQTATVQTVGSVNEAQSSLSAGNKYYVLPDGSLTDTSGEIYAGIAVASNKIIVKG